MRVADNDPLDACESRQPVLLHAQELVGRSLAAVEENALGRDGEKETAHYTSRRVFSATISVFAGKRGSRSQEEQRARKICRSRSKGLESPFGDWTSGKPSGTTLFGVRQRERLRKRRRRRHDLCGFSGNEGDDRSRFLANDTSKPFPQSPRWKRRMERTMRPAEGRRRARHFARDRA